MAKNPPTVVLSRLRQLAHLSGAGTLSDSQLLERFVRARDEAAFEVLVRRHGPMVLDVCRRLLRPQDAEDAFQATFLVLVCKAASVGRSELLANWLYGVAYKVSARLRGTLWRRRTVALPDADVPPRTPPPPDDGAAVHEEVHRLPAKYRQPVVLCYFEGKTNEEAARQLGWPAGTVAGRLARRQVLHHGPACAALVAELARKLPADSPKRLRLSAVLANLEMQTKEEQTLRHIDEAFHRSAELTKGRKNAAPKVAVLLARQGVCDQVPWQRHPFRVLCYFSFPKGENGYAGAVSLEFGNGGGDALQANMYGGQENRLRDLGPVEFDTVKRAPPRDDIKKWGDPRASRARAAVGHVYLEHCFEERDNIDTVVKFKVLAMKPGVWLILEYEVLGPPRPDA